MTKPTLESAVAQLLADTRALIADQKRWCQGAWARDVNGQPVATRSSAAYSFCGDGALRVVAERLAKQQRWLHNGIDPSEVRWQAESQIGDCSPEGWGLISVNDQKGWWAVLDLFARAHAAWLAAHPQAVPEAATT